MKYNPQKIEKKWQKYWEAKKIYRASERSKKPKYYQLETFPYPSAAGLHVGHPKGYIAEDIHARYMRMNGYEVLYTMGWDAFGLPTENYAIKVGKSPREVAAANIKNFKRQVKMFGLSYDWDREINTSSPEYYKWTQWLFIQLFKKGLAYRAKAKVNWCPKDQTVLANEQVIDGKCERDGEQVVQKEMEQWFFKITDYVEKLLSDLDGLNWPEATIKRQQDWIGRSEGSFIKFLLKTQTNTDFKRTNAEMVQHGSVSSPDESVFVEVFTTRPDTLFGATYVVLAPEHSLVEELKGKITNWPEVQKYVEAAKRKTELQRKEEAKGKTGVELRGVKAINPATKEEIPVWIADYALMGYGTGAIMAVPAHDERDYEFAKKFNLPIKIVVEPLFIQTTPPGQVVEGKPFVERQGIMAVVKHWNEDQYIGLKWKKVDWQTVITGGVEKGQTLEQSAVSEIIEETGYLHPKLVKELGVNHSKFFHVPKQENRFGHFHMLYFELEDGECKELSDAENDIHEVLWLTASEMDKFLSPASHRYTWSILRNPDQAYAGEGILTNSSQFDGMGSEEAKWEITKFVGGQRKVQYKLRDWSVSRQRYWGASIPMIHCGGCGIVPVPEEDLPVKLPPLKNYRPTGMPPLASSEKFMKVKCPQCGNWAKRDPETLDTFVDSSWYYLAYAMQGISNFQFSIYNYIQALNHWLPVDLYIIGAEHTTAHLLYARFIAKFLHDQGYLKFKEPFLKLRHQGMILGPDGRRMSKRWGNVINPDDVIKEYGADVARMYEMFMGPFEDGQPWDTKGIVGVYRFMTKFWEFTQKTIGSPDFKKALTAEEEKILIHKTIKKVGEDIKNLKFNTAVSAMMVLLNGLARGGEKGEGMSVVPIGRPDFEMILKILHPFAPHVTEELWQQLHEQQQIFPRKSASNLRKSAVKSIIDEHWPKYDLNLVLEKTIRLVVQINGKTRDVIEMPAGLDEAAARDAALASVKVKKHIAGREIKKAIYVPGRLINLTLLE